MKILIVNNNMHVGGIQNALINLLQELSKNDSYDVTLCVLGNVGEQLDAVPSGIKLISGNRFTKILGLKQSEARQDGLFTWLWRTAFVVLTKMFGTKLTYGILSRMQKINEHYDAAVSFMLFPLKNSGLAVISVSTNRVLFLRVRHPACSIRLWIK